MQNPGTALVVKIFVFNDSGEILLLQRSQSSPVRPDGWDLPGGIVGYNEDPDDSVLRELNEETSLVARGSRVFYVGTETEPLHIVTLFYKAKTKSTNITLSEEHEQFKWAKPETILKLQMPQKFANAIRFLSEG